MRKVLLRIVFDELWKFEAAGNEFLLGYGIVLSAWILVALVCLGLLWKSAKEPGEMVSSVLFWAFIPAALLAIANLQLGITKTGIPLFGYGFMLTVGLITATALAGRRAVTTGLDSTVIWDMMMWMVIPGIAGARIVYLLQYGGQVFANKSGLNLILAALSLQDGGIVFYGGVIGGVIGLLVFCRKRQLRPLQLMDIAMPSLFVGLGFGRIGCFLYGCCFGAACSLPWAVHFPQDSLTFERLAYRSFDNDTKLLEADSTPATAAELLEARHLALVDRKFIPVGETLLTTIALHPAQLYSSTLAFALFAVLAWYFPRRPFEGAVMAMGWILYPINRFVLEIIRDDEPGRMGTSLTFSQLMSIGLFLTGCALMYWLHRKHAGRTNTNTRPSGT